LILSHCLNRCEPLILIYGTSNPLIPQYFSNLVIYLRHDELVPTYPYQGIVFKNLYGYMSMKG